MCLVTCVTTELFGPTTPSLLLAKWLVLRPQIGLKHPHGALIGLSEAIMRASYIVTVKILGLAARPSRALDLINRVRLLFASS